MSEHSARLRAAVDTNLFVSGTILKRGNPFALLEAWRAQIFILLLSEEQHAELTEVFSRPHIVRDYHLTLGEITELFARLAQAIRVVPDSTVPIPLRDPKDEHILATALDGAADYLVTGDNDLLVHRNDPRLGRLRIVTAAEFLAILDALEAARGE